MNEQGHSCVLPARLHGVGWENLPVLFLHLTLSLRVARVNIKIRPFRVCKTRPINGPDRMPPRPRLTNLLYVFPKWYARGLSWDTAFIVVPRLFCPPTLLFYKAYMPSTRISEGVETVYDYLYWTVYDYLYYQMIRRMNNFLYTSRKQCEVRTDFSVGRRPGLWTKRIVTPALNTRHKCPHDGQMNRSLIPRSSQSERSCGYRPVNSSVRIIIELQG